MSAQQIENKIENYLRDSQALEDYRQKPMATEQLQAEMERMARHTKQPEVLRELFEALGNDASVIAECLARPVLVERSVADLSAHDKDQRFALLRTQAAGRKFSIKTSGKATYTPPEIVHSRLGLLANLLAFLSKPVLLAEETADFKQFKYWLQR